MPTAFTMNNQLSKNSINLRSITLFFSLVSLMAWAIVWLISLQNINPLILLPVIPVCFALTRIANNWREGVAWIVVWFVVVDLVRKTMGGTKLLLVVGDGLVALVLFIFFCGSYLFRNHAVFTHVPSNIRFLLTGFSFFVIIQSLNPVVPDHILRLAGLRTYLFYILAMGLGLVFLRTESDLKKIYKFLFILTVPVILLSFFQASSSQANLPVWLVSMEHEVHSFGNFYINLISSTFASCKRYGRFLFLAYPFIYGIDRYYHTSKIGALLLFLFFISAAVVSGSKEIVVMLILFQFMYWILTSANKSKKYLICFFIALGIIGVWNTILQFDSVDITERNYRVKAILSNQQDWKDRIRIYFYDPFVGLMRGYTDLELLLGNGIGTHGQEMALLGDDEAIEALGVKRIDGDSGFTKLLVELGVAGLIYFGVMYSIILRVLWKKVRRLRNCKIYPVGVSVLFIPIGWVILFIKAHSILSDGMVSFGLWFSIGFILSLREFGEGQRTSIPG